MIGHTSLKRLSFVVGACLAIVFAVSGLPAKDNKKIVDHPDKLKFGPLKFEVPDVADYQHKLANGSSIYIAPDRSLPLVNISVTIRTGS